MTGDQKMAIAELFSGHSEEYLKRHGINFKDDADINTNDTLYKMRQAAIDKWLSERTRRNDVKS